MKKKTVLQKERKEEEENKIKMQLQKKLLSTFSYENKTTANKPKTINFCDFLIGKHKTSTRKTKDILSKKLQESHYR